MDPVEKISSQVAIIGSLKKLAMPSKSLSEIKRSLSETKTDVSEYLITC